MASSADEKLIARYVDAFTRFGELRAYESDAVAQLLLTGELDDWSEPLWRPAHVSVYRSALDAIYTALPGCLPALYEELLLNYRWANVDLDCYMLLANPPGDDLSGLLETIVSDRRWFDVLSASRLVQFAKIGSDNFDAVCFDLSRFRKNDCPVVQVDHEAILCHDRVEIVRQLAPSFRELVVQTIESAQI
jgi:hypothetical protein